MGENASKKQTNKQTQNKQTINPKLEAWWERNQKIRYQTTNEDQADDWHEMKKSSPFVEAGRRWQSKDVTTEYDDGKTMTEDNKRR